MIETKNENAVAANSTTAFFNIVKNSVKFSLFLLKNLPAAYCSGLRIKEANEESCTVEVPFKWFTKNPFRSTYFACLSMAAEMSTGLLAMAHIYRRKPPVSMLIIEMRSQYHKKATGITTFTCTDGSAIKEAIHQSIQTDTPQTVTTYSRGLNQNNELIAEFWFNWSFKAKR